MVLFISGAMLLLLEKSQNWKFVSHWGYHSTLLTKIN